MEVKRRRQGDDGISRTEIVKHETDDTAIIASCGPGDRVSSTWSEVERLNGQRRWGLELEDFAHSGPLDLPDGEPDGHTPDPCLGSLVPGDLPPVLVQLHERILSDVLSSLHVPDNEEGRPYHRAVLILEEDRVSVVDIGHRATLRLAGASDSPLLDDSLHIDPAK